MKDFLILILIFVLAVFGTSIAWWLTMEPSHKKALGGSYGTGFKRILKYGFTGKVED